MIVFDEELFVKNFHRHVHFLRIFFKVNPEYFSKCALTKHIWYHKWLESDPLSWVVKKLFVLRLHFLSRFGTVARLLSYSQSLFKHGWWGSDGWAGFSAACPSCTTCCHTSLWRCTKLARFCTQLVRTWWCACLSSRTRLFLVWLKKISGNAYCVVVSAYLHSCWVLVYVDLGQGQLHSCVNEVLCSINAAFAISNPAVVDAVPLANFIPDFY